MEPGSKKIIGRETKNLLQVSPTKLGFVLEFGYIIDSYKINLLTFSITENLTNESIERNKRTETGLEMKEKDKKKQSLGKKKKQSFMLLY